MTHPQSELDEENSEPLDRIDRNRCRRFFLICASFPVHDQFDIRQVALYLLCIQLMPTATLWHSAHRIQGMDWVHVGGGFVISLYLFSHMIYPHTRCSFGGGDPATVTLMIKSNDPGRPAPKS